MQGMMIHPKATAFRARVGSIENLEQLFSILPARFDQAIRVELSESGRTPLGGDHEWVIGMSDAPCDLVRELVGWEKYGCRPYYTGQENHDWFVSDMQDARTKPGWNTRDERRFQRRKRHPGYWIIASQNREISNLFSNWGNAEVLDPTLPTAVVEGIFLHKYFRYGAEDGLAFGLEGWGLLYRPREEWEEELANLKAERELNPDEFADEFDELSLLSERCVRDVANALSGKNRSSG